MRGSASHAATAAAAADLRRFRPSIRIHGLVARLANEHDQNERLASLFRDRCGDARLYWYEDVVDRPEVWAKIMYQLGLWAGAGRESPAEGDAQEHDARRAWSPPGSELDIELRQGRASFAADEV